MGNNRKPQNNKNNNKGGKGKQVQNNNNKNNKNNNAKKESEPVEEFRSRKAEERARRANLRKERNKQKYQTTDKYRRDFEQLLAQLRPIGLTITDSKGDGNCLFRSISHQLFKTQEMHQKIRQEIVQFIIDNRENFEPFIEDDVPFDTYVEEMAQDKEWGGHLELQAASMLYNVNINIYQADNPRWDINNFPSNHKKIQMSYHDHSHYASVHYPDKVLVPETPSDKHIVQLSQSSNSSVNNSNNSKNNKKNEEDEFSSIEKMIMGSTLIKDIKLIRQSLLDFNNDVDLTIEYLYTVRESLWESQSGNNNNNQEDFMKEISNIDELNQQLPSDILKEEDLIGYVVSPEQSPIVNNIIVNSDQDSQSDIQPENQYTKPSANPKQNYNQRQNNNQKQNGKKNVHLSNNERKRIQRLDKQQRKKEQQLAKLNPSSEESRLEEERQKQIESLSVPQMASLSI